MEPRTLWILALVPLAGAGLFIIFAVRQRGPEDTVFVAGLRAVCLLYARLVHRLRVTGQRPDPLPAAGPCLLVANHRSGVDPVILSITTRRRIRFLMAREYYETPILNWMCRALGCIPVRRDGSDLGATKAALKALREGAVIGIFPQGGIREAGADLEGKAGVALLALRTGAPVVPAYVQGSPNLDSVGRAIFTPSRTRVIFGAPLTFAAPQSRKPSREELEEVTARILEAVASLAVEKAPQAAEAA
jgi:1-acyl-sn-glycerol-3-phosphate acyltransferase